MNLMSTRLQEAADLVEKEMEKYQELLERAVMRRDYPDRPKTERPSISGPVPWRSSSEKFKSL